MMQQKIPGHIAIIMDGNGRWAKKRGLPRTAGHKQGAENIRKIAIACNDLQVKALTLYAFSTENWKRPEKEVDYLCKLPRFFFKSYMAELKRNNIQVLYLGELDKFPEDTRNVIATAVAETKGNTGLKLCLAVNYGARREIVLAAQRYASDVCEGKRSLDIDETEFAGYLMTSQLPEVDLLIRTSGEVRISNFLLWQIAYSELIFTDRSWPEFDEEELRKAIDEYTLRDRRFGGLKDEN